MYSWKQREECGDRNTAMRVLAARIENLHDNQPSRHWRADQAKLDPITEKEMVEFASMWGIPFDWDLLTVTLDIKEEDSRWDPSYC